MNRTMMAILTSIIVAGACPLYGQDYLVKLEMINETETTTATTFGKKRPIKTSEVRTLEILVTSGQRFQARTSWANDYLLAKGKLVLDDDGKLQLEIDFGQFHKTGVFIPNPDGTKHEIEDRTGCHTTVILEPGKPQILGGVGGVNDDAIKKRLIKQRATLQVTVAEGDVVK